MTLKNKLKRALSVFSAHFLAGMLLKSLRASLLLFGGVMLLSSTSAWKFMESSFSAHDLVREAAWTKNIGSDVLVIGIDDTAFGSFFDGTSPLRRDRLQTLLRTVQQSAPRAQRIVVDLDLAPVAGSDQSGLATFFSEQPTLWVIADPIRGVADDTPQARAWYGELCRKGVLLGRPYLPTDFGSVNPRYQFLDSLSQVALSGKSACGQRSTLAQQGASQDDTLALQRVPASMSPIYASEGLVVPFHGNLDELATLVKTINPRYIALGGMWGTGDVLSTPFGDRYGVQLHGAAIDGALKSYRSIPYAFNFLVLWVSISLMTITLSLFKEWLEKLMGRHISELPGHQFLMERIWPLTALTLIFFALIALAEVLAFVFSLTGLQVNTSVVAGSLLTYMIFIWNFGRGNITRQQNAPVTWNNMFISPVKADWCSLRLSTHRLLNKPLATVAQTATYDTLSVGRAIFEAVTSLLSLLLQTVIPTIIMSYTVYKSF